MTFEWKRKVRTAFMVGTGQCFKTGPNRGRIRFDHETGQVIRFFFFLSTIKQID